MENLVALKDVFASNLHSMLEARGMSQSDLARRLKVTPAYVSHLLHGRRTPQLETLERLAKAMHCRPVDFLSEN